MLNPMIIRKRTKNGVVYQIVANSAVIIPSEIVKKTNYLILVDWQVLSSLSKMRLLATGLVV
jgi:hypothetical protein